MTTRLEAFTADHADTLVRLLAGEQWPFHSGAGLTEDDVRQRIDAGFYTQPDVRTFLIIDADEVVGYIRLFDLGDEPMSTETPLFDIRLKENVRGRGIGGRAVRLLVDYVFTTWPVKTRVEATTRHDNIAMRRVLQRCGFAKEAHYRQAWPDRSGAAVDCVGYGILRTDWERGTTTPVRWQDEEEV